MIIFRFSILLFPVVLSGMTFEVGLRAALESFERGDWVEAHERMQRFESVFGEEPEFLEEAVRKGWLARRGWAALAVGDAEQASTAFAGWLEAYESPLQVLRLVSYGYAEALQQSGQLAEALEAWRGYERSERQRPAMAHLAKLRVADLQYRLLLWDEALGTIEDLYAEATTDALREEAGLRLLQWATERKESERIKAMLRERPDILNSAEPVAWFRAWMTAAQELLWEGDAGGAWQVLRHLPSPESLRQESLARLREGRIRLQATGGSTHGANLQWQQFHSNRQQRLQQQDEWLRQTDSLAEHTWLLRGQAAFESGRLYEAAFLWRHLSYTQTAPNNIRQDAHFRWILALHRLEDWTRLEEAVLCFRQQHPQSEKLPHILFTSADALRQQGRPQQALSLLAALIADYPGHDLQAFWEFSRGMIELNRGNWQTAVAHFKSSRGLKTHYPIREVAQLWEALAWFEGDHATEALVLLDPLVTNLPEDHPQHAPALYHRARIQRAKDQLTAALDDCRKLLSLHGDHPLAAETHLLSGELYMETGHPALALQHFAAIPPERTLLFEHAAFQSARIHRALANWTALRAHWRHYLELAQAHTLGRRAEAVQQVIESYAFEQRWTEAVDTFEANWDNISLDPHSGDTEDLLAVGARLWQRLGRTGADSFARWLLNQKQQAQAEHLHLRTSRIVQYLATAEGLDRIWQPQHPLVEQLLLLPRALVDARTATWQLLASAEPLTKEQIEFLEDLLEETQTTVQTAGDIHYTLARAAALASDYTEQIYQLRRLISDYPGHPREPSARLQLALVYKAQGELNASVQTLSELLGNRSARGRLQAEALSMLARIYQLQGKADLAVATWQRLLAVHRAQADIVQEAEQALSLVQAHSTDNEV